MRKSIAAEEKYPSRKSGESYVSVPDSLKNHRNVHFNCFKVSALICMKLPETEQEWDDIMNKTYERWQCPNGYAAVDGKHIRIVCPPDSGSDFSNYKKFYSN